MRSQSPSKSLILVANALLVFPDVFVLAVERFFDEAEQANASSHIGSIRPKSSRKLGSHPLSHSNLTILSTSSLLFLLLLFFVGFIASVRLAGDVSTVQTKCGVQEIV